MKKKIKLGFADKWGGFVPEEDFYYKLLARHYDIELSDAPDYLICSQNGHSHIKYDCVKIVDIGENIVPDFNEFDYAVGFDHLEFGDRYLRVPLYVFFAEYPKLAERATPPPDDVLLNRKFCSFVVTNGGYGDPMRTKFFHALSKYKRVDSGGRYLNNIGGNVKDKMAFCSQYKFNIAFENSSSPGYTTEKVMQPLSCFSVPIYWGNPLIAKDFTPASMVCVRDEADIDRAIEEIVRLDTDDAAYLEKVKAPCLVQPHDFYEKELEKFLCHIIDQPLEEARRLNRYGFQTIHRFRMRRLYAIQDALAAPVKLMRRVKSALR
ncbi:MAG: glycosyltransferase [Kiritimatiellae bacterium]|nr:glycosyltransferase [Kiritimatiellia bacterium]